MPSLFKTRGEPVEPGVLKGGGGRPIMTPMAEPFFYLDAYDRAIGLEADPAVRRFLQRRRGERGQPPPIPLNLPTIPVGTK